MLVYPQLTSGALVQYPVQKRRRLRTVVNSLADGSSVKLADAAGAITEWELQYTGLSDAEASALQQFFEAAEGSLNPFTFLDPMGNLFAWSDQLDDSAWAKDPMLVLTGRVADVAGGRNGWHVQNIGAGAQCITQTLTVPDSYVYCLSVYVQSSQSDQVVTLLLGGQRHSQPAGSAWSRISVTGSGDASSGNVTFGIELPAGASVNLYGLQAEAQAAPAVYKPSASGGVYPNTAFRDDLLSLTATDVNRHSATLNLIHANG
jgi:hypothetical protein